MLVWAGQLERALAGSWLTRTSLLLWTLQMSSHLWSAGGVPATYTYMVPIRVLLVPLLPPVLHWALHHSVVATHANTSKSGLSLRSTRDHRVNIALLLSPLVLLLAVTSLSSWSSRMQDFNQWCTLVHNVTACEPSAAN